MDATSARNTPKSLMWVVFLGFFMNLLAATNFAQQRRLSFHHLDIQDGLPKTTVHRILPTQAGYVWFATDGGLFRFDGVRVEPHLVDLNLDFVTALHQRADGSIWIGTKRRLYRYADGVAQQIPIPRRQDDRQPEDFVRDFAESADGRFYVGTHVGIYRILDDAHLKRIILDPRKGFKNASDVVFSLAMGADGVCLCGTGAGLYSLDDEDKPRRILSPRSLDPTLRSSIVTEVFVTQSGDRWFVSLVDAYRLPRNGEKKISVLKDRQGKHIAGGTRFVEDEKGRIWLGTVEDGVILLDGNSTQGQRIPVASSKTVGGGVNGMITSMTMAPNGILWLASKPGIQFVDLKTHEFSWYEPKRMKGSMKATVQSAVLDSKNRKWIGTQSAGLQIVEEDGTWITCSTTQDKAFHLPILQIDTLSIGPADRIVVGNAHEGLFEWSPSGFLPLKLEFMGEKGTEIRATQFRNSTLVVATNKGLYEEQGVGWRQLRLTHGSLARYPSIKPRNLKVTSGGLLYVATSFGLFVEQEDGDFLFCGDPRNPDVDVPMKSNVIFAAIELDPGRFLVALATSLAVIDMSAKTVTGFKVEDELGARIAALDSFVLDHNKILWATSLNGFFAIDLEGRTARSFDLYEGIQPGSLKNVQLLGSGGTQLYVAGDAGITFFSSAEATRRSAAPDFRLVGFMVNGSDRLLSSPETIMKLDWKENSITLRLAAFHHLNPGRNRFAFRLRGVSENWQDIGTSGLIHLANLQPGDYRIEARACSSDGSWSQASLMAQFSIVPPFWKTPWFQWGVSVFVFFGLICVQGILLRQARVRSEQLEEQVSARTASLRARTDELQGIHALLKTVNSATSLDQLLAGTLEQVLLVMSAEHGVFVINEQGGDRFVVMASEGAGALAQGTMTREETRREFEGQTKELEVGIFMSDSGEEWGKGRSLAIKLTDEDHVLGYIRAGRNLDSEPFEGDFVQLMVRLREPVTLALKRLRLLDVLSELNEEKTELLGAAAHDLRSPLSAMGLTAENILARLPSTSIEEVQDDIGRILRATNRMSSLVNKLLDVAAIDSGKVGLEIVETHLDLLLRNRLAVARINAEKKEIALSFHPPERDVIVPLDSDRVAAAVDNLISNAVKYTHVGGQVDLRLLTYADRVEIVVEDDGQGLPEEEVERLFKSFGRMSAKPTANETSTGFGLAIVKKVVDLHGGDVWARKREGRGMVFTIALPRDSDTTPVT